MSGGGVEVLVQHDLPVPADDGIALMTDVYRPADGEARPCLVQRVAYDKSHPASLSGALDVLHAARAGYSVAVQDCRGRFASEGTFVPFEREREDTLATIRWAAAQPWCDGRVCLFGRSYSALLQWLVADSGLPELRAIAPMLSGADLVEGWLAPQGAFEFGFVVLWSLRHLAPNMLARDATAAEGARLLALIEDVDRVYRDLDAADRSWLGERLPFLDALLDPGVRERTLARYDALGVDPAAASVPALVVAGWFDIFLEGCLASFRALPAGRRGLVVGPWPHGGSNPGVFPERGFGPRASSDALGLTRIQLDWFQRWLDPGDGTAEDDPVHVFTMGENRWRRTGWPPAEPERRVLAFTVQDGRGALSETAAEASVASVIAYDEEHPLPTVGGPTFLPGFEVAANAGPRDQRELLERDDAGVFLGPPLPEPLVVEGTVEAELHVDAPPADTLFVARLLDMSRDGRALLVCESGVRTPAYEGDGPVAVGIRIGTTSYRFEADHRIGLVIANSSFPRYDRSVRAGAAPDGRRGRVTLLSGRDHPSRIELPVRPTDREEMPRAASNRI